MKTNHLSAVDSILGAARVAELQESTPIEAANRMLAEQWKQFGPPALARLAAIGQSADFADAARLLQHGERPLLRAGYNQERIASLFDDLRAVHRLYSNATSQLHRAHEGIMDGTTAEQERAIYAVPHSARLLSLLHGVTYADKDIGEALSRAKEKWHAVANSTPKPNAKVLSIAPSSWDSTDQTRQLTTFDVFNGPSKDAA